MKTKVFLVFVFLFLLFFVYKMNQNNSTPINNLEYKNFTCEGMRDIYFQFPSFKDWEFKGIENKNENLCIMYFNSPEGIEYEYPPQIVVEKIASINKSEKAKQNQKGIYYEYIQDPTLYVENHKFEEGDWDWLVFYGPEFSVRISKNGSVKPPFDDSIFYNKIIETFDFKPI